MAIITVDLLTDFANKFAAKVTERFVKRTDIPDIPEDAKFTDTTYSAMGAATASQAGTEGMVPAPAAGAQGKFLRGDGTWQIPENTTYSAATASKAGLMSAADKIKLENMEEATAADMDSIISGAFQEGSENE